MPERSDSPSGPADTTESKGAVPLGEVEAKRSRRSRRGGREGWQPQGEPPTNSVSVDRSHAAEETRKQTPPRGAPTDTRSGTTAVDPGTAIPKHISDKYLRVGSRYYFPDRDPAFRVGATRTTTQLDSPEVVRDIVQIEHARSEGLPLKLQGSKKFRLEAWRQATLLDIETKGYRPSKVELAQIEREQVELAAARVAAGHRSAYSPSSHPPPRAAEVPSASDTGSVPPDREPPVPPEKQTVRGRLIEHGRAPLDHHQHGKMSYYAKVASDRGEVTEVWGKDLQRAIERSLSEVRTGSLVTVQYAGELAVKVNTRTLDDDGTVKRGEEVKELRNRFIVETQAFLKKREALATILRDPNTDPKEAVRRHPSLAGAFVQVYAAERIASEFPDETSRRDFVDLVRNQLAAQIARGEAMPAAQVYRAKTRTAPQHDPRVQAQERVLS